MLKLFYNAKIYTADNNLIWADFIITNNNLIFFVGNSKHEKDYKFLKKYYNLVDEKYDLNNKLVLPGFIDCHAHIIMGGFYINSLDLSDVKSKQEFINKVIKYSNDNPGKPIYGGNFNHQNWDVKEFPSKDWIDSFTQNIPLFLHRMDYHSAIANSYALNLAGINSNTPNPVGGEILKDPVTGEPTGMLKDKAMDLVAEKLPPRTKEEYYEACLATLNLAKKFGVTSIQDIAYKNDFATYQDLLKQNKLTVRIYTRLPIDKSNYLINCEFKNGFGNNLLKFGGVKAFADGSLGSYTALFFEPYEDDKNSYGLATDILLNGELEKNAISADKHEIQLSIHAIGDKAVNEILNLAEKLNEVNGNKDRRFRIEHAQHILKQDILRFNKLNVIASMQPYHLFDDGCWAINKIGEERLKYTLAFNSFLKNNVKVCFGSDFPVATLNPLLGIYTALTRHTADGKNSNGLIPEEKITVEEAVKAYTINAAYAAFEEDIKGSITKGKLADFIVLSNNIFEIEPDNIKNTFVEMTIFDGEIIYSK